MRSERRRRNATYPTVPFAPPSSSFFPASPRLPKSSSQSQAASTVPAMITTQQTMLTAFGTVPSKISPNTTAHAE